ncbi:MAG TPA: cystathionine gamma-lyase [Pseudonocardiaceae bacterium]|nr:cystathionine gamma-lyase [Pseudonocardiaceae bacterium]
MTQQEWGDGTLCGRAGLPEPVAGQPFLPPPVFAAPFHLGAGAADFYGAADNPTWRALEAALGELDGGEAVLFPAGMGAIATVLSTLTGPGDTVVLPSDGYYLTRQLMADRLPDRTVRLVPTAGEWTADLVAGAALVLVETPSNPGMDICDIAAVAELTRQAGALLAVDNTTATPLGQRPLALGADLCLASDTKALSGHSDVVLGHVSCTDAGLAARLRTARRQGGLAPGPFEVWLAHRGLGTLDLRLARQARNAATLVAALRVHPLVTRLRWPGSPDDPGHALACRQMRRFGGVFSFELPSQDAVEALVAGSELLTAATSFGGLHSTVDRRAQWGDPVPPGFVRFSCGTEDTDDLVTDVLRSLDRVHSSEPLDRDAG